MAGRLFQQKDTEKKEAEAQGMLTSLGMEEMLRSATGRSWE